MFLQVVKSEGLAHLSYIIGDGDQAAVIDPRRDCEVYLDIANQHGTRITHIFETHRHEDFVVGSQELANLTGAKIYHGSELPFEYGETVQEHACFELGAFKLKAIKTPGHTFESISLAVADSNFSADKPISVFTGDTLFIGDVGRTDFFPEQAEKVAGLLYDSINDKLLPLGDEVIVYPAHGSGSVCGGGIADREFSTLGYERRHNPLLQIKDRDTFIHHKMNEHHYQPPYFRKMEQFNLKGAPLLQGLPQPQPVNAADFAKAMDAGMIVLDVRSAEAIAAASIPGSIGIPLNLVPAFAGWFLPYDKPIGLVAASVEDMETAVRYLVRLGYEGLPMFLYGGLSAWEVSGQDYEHIVSVHANVLKQQSQRNDLDHVLLDVRSVDEYKTEHLPNSTHIYVGEVPLHLEKLDKNKRYTVFCGSGMRAIVAASLLKQAEFNNVAVCLGSMEACKAIGCDTLAA